MTRKNTKWPEPGQGLWRWREILAFGTIWWVHVSVAAMDPGGPDRPCPHHYPPGVVKWSLTNLLGLVHMALFFSFVSGILSYTLNMHGFITQRNMALFFIVHYLPK